MDDVTPARSLLTRIGELLHRRADARARAAGWEIERSRSGLGRTYRDGRWRHVRPCRRCGGSGVLGRRDCGWCAGTGRLVHRPGRAAS